MVTRHFTLLTLLKTLSFTEHYNSISLVFIASKSLDMHLFHSLSQGEVNTSTMSPPDKHLISYVFVLQSLTTLYQVLNVFLLPRSDRSIFLPAPSSCNRDATDLDHLFDIPHNSALRLHTPGNSFLGQIHPVSCLQFYFLAAVLAFQFHPPVDFFFDIYQS